MYQKWGIRKVSSAKLGGCGPFESNQLNGVDWKGWATHLTESEPLGHTNGNYQWPITRLLPKVWRTEYNVSLRTLGDLILWRTQMYPSTDELVEKLGQWKKGKESSLWSVAVEYDQTGLGLAREEMVRLQAEIDAINYASEHPK